VQKKGFAFDEDCFGCLLVLLGNYFCCPWSFLVIAIFVYWWLRWAIQNPLEAQETIRQLLDNLEDLVRRFVDLVRRFNEVWHPNEEDVVDEAEEEVKENDHKKQRKSSSSRTNSCLRGTVADDSRNEKEPESTSS